MELTQIQVEAIDASSREGPIDPGPFAKNLLLDGPETEEAFAELERQGLMIQGDDGRYSLTGDGVALHRVWEARESAAVKRRTRTWQPR